MTARDRLTQVARLLWGDRWQTAMCQELKVNRRTLSRYVHGKAIPEYLLLELEGTMILRMGKLSQALDAPTATLLPDGVVLVFTAEGEPVKPEGNLLTAIRAALEEVRAHHMKGPADAE